MINEENLPEGWEILEIKGLISKTATENPNQEYPDDLFYYIDISSIDLEKGKILKNDPILGKEAPSRARQKVKTNDLLISTVRPNLNGVALVPGELDGQICSTGFCVLRTNEKVVPTYLFYFSRTKYFIESLVQRCRGASYPAVTNKDVLSVKIPIPPLKTQQKIVEILEKAEKLKEYRAEADVKTDEYLKSVFLEMFGDPVGNSKNWMTRNISDTCKTSSGGTPSRSRKEYYGGEIPWVKSGELNNGVIYDTEEKITELGMKSSSAKLLNPNTILIAMYGATVGKTALLKINATTNQAVCAIQPNKDYLNNMYLLNCLKLLSDYLVGQSIGGGQPNISQQIIKRTKIPIPPIELQNQFAETVKKVEQLKKHQKQSKQEIDNLFNTLMQKAFKGELTC